MTFFVENRRNRWIETQVTTISAMRASCGEGFRAIIQYGVVLLAVLPVDSSRVSLFELSPDVKELNEDTLPSAVESGVPWVIDCYSPGCPHCTRFAPTWEAVGAALQDSPVQVGAINCAKHRDLCESLKVGRYPSLYALNWPGAPTGTAAEPAAKLIKTGGGSADDIFGLIKGIFSDMAAGSVVARELESHIGAEVGEAGGSRGGGGAACLLRVEDAAVSVRWILTYDVFTQGSQLSKERMEAVLSFLDLLATTFPGHANRASFHELATELRSDPGLNSMGRWDNRINNLDIGSFASTNDATWPAAILETKSERNVNHLTSGLWSLFHVLSVSSAPMRQKPYVVMEGILSFIDNFFRCEECRRHFMQMYDACDNGRCAIPPVSGVRGGQPAEGDASLALWVWRMHNAVNARLAQEGAEEVKGYKNIWPSVPSCINCWTGAPSKDDQPYWNEEEVLKFLTATYSCPETVAERPGSSGGSWAVTIVFVCTIVAVAMWARRWLDSRGVGLSKKRVDALPSV